MEGDSAQNPVNEMGMLPIAGETLKVTHGRRVERASGVGLFSIVMEIVLSIASAFFRIEAQAVALLLAMSTMAAVAQVPQSRPKATELVVRQYEQFWRAVCF
jgi:hypothetical protein